MSNVIVRCLRPERERVQDWEELRLKDKFTFVHFYSLGLGWCDTIFSQRRPTQSVGLSVVAALGSGPSDQ